MKVEVEFWIWAPVSCGATPNLAQSLSRNTYTELLQLHTCSQWPAPLCGILCRGKSHRRTCLQKISAASKITSILAHSAVGSAKFCTGNGIKHSGWSGEITHPKWGAFSSCCHCFDCWLCAGRGSSLYPAVSAGFFEHLMDYSREWHGNGESGNSAVIPQ